MAIKRGGLWRSLFRPLTGFLGNTGPSEGRRDKRARFGGIERLEDRRVMTTTVYIDFLDGIGAAGGLFITPSELRTELSGPDIWDPGFQPLMIPALLDNDPVTFRPFNLVAQDLRRDLNLFGIGSQSPNWEQLSDIPALKNRVVSIVKRQFEPFDINVEVVAARSRQDIVNIMKRNTGDPTGQNDAYVIVGGFLNPTSLLTGVGFDQGWLGISAAFDLIESDANVRDEVVLLDAKFTMEAFTFGSPIDTVPFDIALGNIASHEAAHSLAQRHTSTGFAFPTAQQQADAALLTRSDIMRAGGNNDDLRNISLFTRFDLPLNEDFENFFAANQNFNNRRNPFMKLALDPDIGLRAGAPEYVTGTGAFDRITIQRLDTSTAQVLVEAHRNATFTSLIYSNSYIIDTTRGILLEGGMGVDRFVIDPLLATNITIRGGQGMDEILLDGAGVLHGTFLPGQTFRRIPGLEDYNNDGFIADRFFAYSGTIVAGNTTINFDEFDDAGKLIVEDFASFSFPGSEGADNLQLIAGPTGTLEVEGTLQGVAFPNLRFSNVQSFLLSSGTSSAADIVTINAINATGLNSLVVTTGGGNDIINVNVANLTLPVAGGGIHVDAGLGADTLNVRGDANWTLTDSAIISSLGAGILTYTGLAGETIGITGGGGANTFNVGAFNGRARITGLAGNDILQITRDASFAYSDTFVNVLGGPSFTLGTIDRLELTGGPSSNTFIDFGWNGQGALDGAGGVDSVSIFRDAHVQLADTEYRAGAGFGLAALMTLANIEAGYVTGGAGHNQINLTGWTRNATINGQGGFDQVVVARDANYTLTNSSLIVSNAATSIYGLSNIDFVSLTGGGGGNTFNIIQWSGGGFFFGEAGDDTLNFGSGFLDILTGFYQFNGGVGNDRIVFNDGGHATAGNYVLTPTSFTVQGPFRRFGSFTYNGTTENVELQASRGVNRIDVTPSLTTTYLVDGNGPAAAFSGDLIVLHFTGTTGRTLQNGPGPGQRRWTFTSGHRDIIFQEIGQTAEAP